MSIVDALFRKVKPDKGVNMPTFQRPLPNEEQQGDILFLPSDRGYKYALVVADVGSRLTEAEPIKDKTNVTVLKAFKKIYNRNILKLPKQIDFDDGSEFKGTVSKFFKDQDIIVHVAIPHRHRQQAIVERKNQLIGTKLFKRMIEEELLTGEPSTQWVDELKDIIKTMNANQKKQKIKKPDDKYITSGESHIILSEGTKVRVALNAPIDVVTQKRLHGKFRDTDIRWKIKPNTIKQVIIQPNQPVMYLVDDENGNTDHRQAYTKNQLLPVKDNERAANEKAIRPLKKQKGQQVYRIEKIVDSKKEKNKLFYLVKWVGFKKPTWEPSSTINKDSPLAVEKYKEKQKIT